MKNFNDKDDEADIFNALFEAIQDYAFILHSDGTIWDANKNALIILGYTEEELIGKHILQLTPSGDPCDAYNKIWELTREWNKTSFETFICTKSNEEMNVEINAHFLGKENTGTVLISYRNIAHQKKIESVLERHEYKYKDVIQSCPDGFLMMKPDGQILDSNPAYTELSGYTKEELLSKNYFDLIAGKKGKIAQNSLFNNFHRNKRGDLIPVKVKIRPWKNENGDDILLIFIYTINEYLQFLDQIKKEREIMQKILTGIANKDTVGVLITKVGVGIRYANDFISNALGYQKQELEKLEYKDFIHPNDLGTSMQDYAKIISGELPKLHTKWRLVHKDDSVIQCDITLNKHHDDSGHTMLITHFENVLELEDTVERTQQADIVKLISTINNHQTSGILVSKPGAGFCYANKHWHEAFGYKSSEMDQVHANDFIHPDIFDVTVQNITKVFKGDLTNSSATGRFLRKDGSTIIADLTTTKRIDDATKTVFVILQFENIAEYIETEPASLN
ncbi:MAG: PAS domain S-box protein [Leptospirales bacterium]